MAQVNGDLFVFDYTAHLKIVGAYHALNQKDKRTLSRLIDASDFVALELDPIRAYNFGIHIWISRENGFRGYSANDNTLYVSAIDYAYLLWYESFTKKKISKYNNSVATETGIIRDVKENEFSYCLRISISLFI